MGQTKAMRFLRRNYRQRSQQTAPARVHVPGLSATYTGKTHTGASVPAKISQANTVLATKLKMMYTRSPKR